MKKDIGRRIWIEDIIKKTNGHIWEGEDPTELDQSGYIKSWEPHTSATWYAKLTKKKLFEHFLANSKSEYLFLFEDDISVHKNFYNNLNTVISFINTNKVKLLYFGVSRHVDIQSKDNLIIKHLVDNIDDKFEGYSGAYGVIINRNIIPYILVRINNEIIKTKPFDVYCLGNVQKYYFKECYLCHPPMIIPDISSSNIRKNRNQNTFYEFTGIDKGDYIINSQTPLFILVSNIDNFTYINKLSSMFFPIWKIIPLFLQQTHYDLYKNDYECYYVPDNTLEFINKTIYTNKNYTNYFILISDTINWKYHQGHIIFNFVKDHINECDGITFSINSCHKCNSDKTDDDFFIVRKFNLPQDSKNIITYDANIVVHHHTIVAPHIN
jgi:hypothetical protein